MIEFFEFFLLLIFFILKFEILSKILINKVHIIAVISCIIICIEGGMFIISPVLGFIGLTVDFLIFIFILPNINTDTNIDIE